MIMVVDDNFFRAVRRRIHRVEGGVPLRDLGTVGRWLHSGVHRRRILEALLYGIATWPDVGARLLLHWQIRR